MKKLLPFFLLLLTGATALGAELEKFILRGYITLADTTEWVEVDSVYVSLTRSDTIPVPFTVLVGDDSEKMARKGEIRLMVNGGLGEYQLHLDKEGYEPADRDFKITSVNQSVMYIRSVKMRPERFHMLNEVTVRATAVKMVMDGDTIVYNADAFNLSDGSMLDALVQQLPGVQLSASGEISVNGRKVNELIVNGKDFFKGDPQVALQNLPAYAVKNVKVYDKAERDDYLTHATDRLSKDESSENLVMDVVLKKEYNVGYIANVEAGYGLNDRYMGRLFGIGFGDKWRLTVFGNANNISNTEAASSEGTWRDYWSRDGESTVQLGGLEYSYDDEERWYFNGSAEVKHEKPISLGKNAETTYYPSGDLYSRSSSSNRQDAISIDTYHYLTYRGDNVYVGFYPSLSYRKDKSRLRTLSALFSENPPEEYRDQALDSVFGPDAVDSDYWRTMINRLGTLTGDSNERLNAGANLNIRYQPTNLTGYFRLVVTGSHLNNFSSSRTIYAQEFGAANSDVQALPTRSDRYSESRNVRDNAYAQAEYTHNKKWITEKWSSGFNASLRTIYQYDYSDARKELLIAALENGELNPALIAHPELGAPLGAILDPDNSPTSLSRNHKLAPQLTLTYSREPVAPTDSGLNPAFSMDLTLYEDLDWRSLEYLIPRPDYEAQNPRDFNSAFKPYFNAGFRSSNDLRNISVRFSYMMTHTLSSMESKLRAVMNSNPLVVYDYSASNLPRVTANDLSLNFSYFGRKTNSNAYAAVSARLPYKTIGQSSTFNPQTGVTTYRPMLVDGNWHITSYASYGRSFGSRQQVETRFYVSGSFYNSVDFLTDMPGSEPVRSDVKTGQGSAYAGVDYKFVNGSVISAGGSLDYVGATSDAANFNRVNTTTTAVFLRSTVILPWKMEFRTSLNLNMRRGYEDTAMNTTEWIWSASLEKSILKGAMTFKLNAVDILGQRNSIYINVNAARRSETWSNVLPRLVMFSVNYRFNHNPKRK